MDRFWADVRFAARTLRKTPGFTAIAVVTIAIGIGFNAANFSLVHELLLRPIDIPGMDRIVVVQQKAATDLQFDNAVAPRTWLDWQTESKSFEQLAGWEYQVMNLTGSGSPEQVFLVQVSPEFFGVMNTPPAMGRTFQDTTDPIAVISDGLWRRRFGSDPAIIGKPVTIDGVTHTVVGVMPRRFSYPAAAELWTPLPLTPEKRQNRSSRQLGVVGRLRAGVTALQANAEMRGLGERHAELYPATDGGRVTRAVDLARGVTEDTTRSFIVVLTAAAGFLLLIVCANIANLLLARGATRRREMAVRAALGAGRGQIVRQLLTESLLLALLGGGLAVLVAAWSIDFIKAGIPPETTRFIPGWEQMTLNRSVLGFTLVAAVLTAVVFGLAPSVQASATRLGEVLKETGRSVMGARQRLRSVLVVFQVALALILLVGAGVLVKGFLRTANPRRGLDPSNILTFSVAPPDARYGNDERVRDFQQRTLAELRGLPGVTDVATINNIPWGQIGGSLGFTIDGKPVAKAERMPSADLRIISPNYHNLVRIPLLRGRLLTEADNRPDAEKVAVINESAAHRFWPGEDPIGSHFRRGGTGDAWTVVGVVGDVYNHFERLAPATVYVPAGQPSWGNYNHYYAIKTASDPMALANAARTAVNRVDPELPIAELRTLEQTLAVRVSGIRLGATCMLALAAVALLLSGIGIYGVIAYLVTQRQQEIGIRMALGARPAQVLRLVVGRGARLGLLGVALGLPVALGLAHLMSTVLGDIVDADASVFIGLTVLVAGVALAGAFVPARRAARVDPMVALRYE